MTEQIEKFSDIKSWAGTIPVHNLYTVGVAGERFLRAIQKEGRLLSSVCPDCRKEFLPPKVFCPYCLKELKEWKSAPSAGKVETFTVQDSLIYAFVRLTSAGGLLHKLGEIDPTAVKIGLKVEAVFKPASERTGSIQDIDYFRPLRCR